jgi:hypothetical protein
MTTAASGSTVAPSATSRSASAQIAIRLLSAVHGGCTGRDIVAQITALSTYFLWAGEESNLDLMGYEPTALPFELPARGAILRAWKGRHDGYG